MEENPNVAKNIVKRSTETADTYFTYDFALDYVGKLILKYQTLLYEPSTSKCNNTNL